MASADLDTVIRKLTKQQNKPLSAAVKATRDRYNTLATRATDAETRQRYRQIAKQLVEEGQTAIRRLQLSADNIADSYARAVRRAIEAPRSAPKPAKKNAREPAKVEAATLAQTKTRTAKATKTKSKQTPARKKATTKKARA